MSRLSTDELHAIVGRLPTTRDEDWKYTDLSAARDLSTRWLAAGRDAPSLEMEDEIERITANIDAHWIVIANGEVRKFAEIEAVSAVRLAEAPASDSALAELNAALLRDGLRLRFDGQVQKPVALLLIDGASEASVNQAYVEIEFAAGAAAEIIENHASRGEAEQYANTVVSIDIGDNASAKHVRIQARQRTHIQTGRTNVSVGRDARYVMAGFDLGGGLVRNDIVIDIAEPGAEVAFEAADVLVHGVGVGFAIGRGAG